MTRPEIKVFEGEFIFKSKSDADPCVARKGMYKR